MLFSRTLMHLGVPQGCASLAQVPVQVMGGNASMKRSPGGIASVGIRVVQISAQDRAQVHSIGTKVTKEFNYTTTCALHR